MESYHESFNQTSNPYAARIVPPIGMLLDAIRADLSAGGCYRPGNRALARRVGVSASTISTLIAQLVSDGWITYDRESGLITLRGDRLADHLIGQPITYDEQKQTDRFEDRDLPAPVHGRSGDRSPDRMSSSSSTDHDSESTTTTASDRDRVMMLLAEFETVPALRKKALEARPDLTPQQVRDTWAHFEAARMAGRCGAGAFHAAIARGELYAAPAAIPAGGFDPESYRGRDGFFMGGDEWKPTIRDRAQDLTEAAIGKWAAANHAACVAASMFLEKRLSAGDTDETALAALAEITR